MWWNATYNGAMQDTQIAFCILTTLYKPNTDFGFIYKYQTEKIIQLYNLCATKF
jgi:hypothetical protein